MDSMALRASGRPLEGEGGTGGVFVTSTKMLVRSCLLHTDIDVRPCTGAKPCSLQLGPASLLDLCPVAQPGRTRRANKKNGLEDSAHAASPGKTGIIATAPCLSKSLAIHRRHGVHRDGLAAG